MQSELDAAKKEFRHVRTYLDYDEMLRKETTLQAVVVASATTAHAEQCIKAIERGLHVLCEKPISTSPEIVCASRILSLLGPFVERLIADLIFSPKQLSTHTRSR